MTKAAVAALHARCGGDVSVVETGDPEGIDRAVADAVRDGATVVALAGGDGAIRDAAQALAGSGVEVGIIPCGTGNLYASALRVPRDLRAAVAALEGGTARAVDIGEVTLRAPSDAVPLVDGSPRARLPERPRSFVAACGTGLDARMIAATSREMKRRYGVAAYFLAASRQLTDLRPRPTVLTIDGARYELESLVVLVANCGEPIPGILGPRLPIPPDDGLLHVFVLPRGGVIGGVRGALELMLADAQGTSASGHGMRLTGRSVRVEVAPAEPVEIDGDLFPPAVLDARIRAGALRVILS